MSYSEDHIVLAAEYVLGTLDSAERAQVDTMMSVDADFRAIVEGWERKLGELNVMVGSVEPPPELWDKIRAAAQLSSVQLPLALPEIGVQPAPVVTAVGATDSASAIRSAPAAPLRRWKNIAAGAAGLAALLGALAVLQAWRPGLLPEALRGKPLIQTVQVQAPTPAQFAAVLQQGTDVPAFILTIDMATKAFTARRVSAAAEQGGSYELWLVSDKLQRPRSLGVIGVGDFTTRTVLADYDTDTITQATYRVTIEPEGGSPTGMATGPIVFSAKLIETVPPPTAPAR